MMDVSDGWKSIQQRFLLPEAFVEIDSAISEVGLQEAAVATGTNQAAFSSVDGVIGRSDANTTSRKYATLEHNLWALDGTRTIVPDAGPYENTGYVSNIDQSGSVTLTLDKVHTAPIPGVTIVWSSEFEEYPPVFTVAAYNGSVLVAETTVTDNASYRSLVDMEISEYNRVVVTVHNWCLPNRRARIDTVFLGHLLTFTKKDILSFSHKMSGDLLTAELPKYSIEFSLDNTDARWNPSNPSGLERYLSERQKLTVRYGFNIDGSVEWILGGTFYLSEWSAPSNGLEARFVARDVLEFLLGAENTAAYYNSLYEILQMGAASYLPEGASIAVDMSLDDYSAEYNGDSTAAEILQKCANAACCIIRYGRDGYLHVEPFHAYLQDFRIPMSLAYSHPEVTLSKPLKRVSVDYGEERPYELDVFASGETQTVHNDFISSVEQATRVAEWVREVLQSRKSISGEFRPDPRLDIYDVITVESKFGDLSPVVLTEIEYTFSGSFRASYTGRIIGG